MVGALTVASSVTLIKHKALGVDITCVSYCALFVTFTLQAVVVRPVGAEAIDGIVFHEVILHLLVDLIIDGTGPRLDATGPPELPPPI